MTSTSDAGTDVAGTASPAGLGPQVVSGGTGDPVPGPASLAAVKAHLRLAGDADDDQVGAAVAAVNGWVGRLPYATTPAADEDAPPIWPADVTHGAVMLAARIYRRRNSPAGVEAFSDLGGPVYVQRNDPDVAMLLGIGAYARPIVG